MALLADRRPPGHQEEEDSVGERSSRPEADLVAHASETTTGPAGGRCHTWGPVRPADLVGGQPSPVQGTGQRRRTRRCRRCAIAAVLRASCQGGGVLAPKAPLARKIRVHPCPTRLGQLVRRAVGGAWQRLKRLRTPSSRLALTTTSRVTGDCGRDYARRTTIRTLRCFVDTGPTSKIRKPHTSVQRCVPSDVCWTGWTWSSR